MVVEGPLTIFPFDIQKIPRSIQQDINHHNKVEILSKFLSLALNEIVKQPFKMI